MNSSVSNTATVALTTAGGVGVLNWALECISQHHIVQPDQATAAFMVGLAAPVVHGVGRAVSNWFTKKTGIVIPPEQEQTHA